MSIQNYYNQSDQNYTNQIYLKQPLAPNNQKNQNQEIFQPPLPNGNLKYQAPSKINVPSYPTQGPTRVTENGDVSRPLTVSRKRKSYGGKAPKIKHRSNLSSPVRNGMHTSPAPNPVYKTPQHVQGSNIFSAPVSNVHLKTELNGFGPKSYLSPPMQSQKPPPKNVPVKQEVFREPLQSPTSDQFLKPKPSTPPKIQRDCKKTSRPDFYYPEDDKDLENFLAKVESPSPKKSRKKSGNSNILQQALEGLDLDSTLESIENNVPSSTVPYQMETTETALRYLLEGGDEKMNRKSVDTSFLALMDYSVALRANCVSTVKKIRQLSCFKNELIKKIKQGQLNVVQAITEVKSHEKNCPKILSLKPLECQGLPIDWAKDFFLPAKIQPDKQILLQMDNGISTRIENDSKSCRVNCYCHNVEKVPVREKRTSGEHQEKSSRIQIIRWTPLETDKLEELLGPYTPHDKITLERCREMAKVLTDRTPSQIMSRVQTLQRQKLKKFLKAQEDKGAYLGSELPESGTQSQSSSGYFLEETSNTSFTSFSSDFTHSQNSTLT